MEATGAIELDGQYRALREEAGFLAREGRVVIEVTGADAADYLQGQLTQDVEPIEPGSGAYAALLDRKGHMQGDMRVLRLAEERFLLDLEPEASAAVIRHLSTYKIGRDAEINDASAGYALISVIGPGAARMTGAPPLAAEGSHTEMSFGGVECRAVASDLGLDLLLAPKDTGALAASLAAAGIASVEEAAAEIVRVEAGRPRFGREMTTETIPQEAGINERAISFSKGCYIGQETVARLHYKGKPNRHLRGLRSDAVLAAGEKIRAGEKVVGTVGTAVLSPALGPLALAVVRREAQPRDTVTVGSAATAEVVELPF
ncbi:MAG: YgfZ/GcvT domain-containing protein [Solirubrobacterales bacterium]